MNVCLYATFNKITDSEEIPACMKKGIIVPIPKGSKDQTKMTNNHGITVIPMYTRLYEKIFYVRYETDDERNNIDPLQGAAQKHCSSTHTSFLLRETIAYNLEKGSSVIVALLDTSKAFVTVWIQGMFYKLYKDGMDRKLWRVLLNLYDDFECSVKICGVLSDWFVAQQGGHQGAPWSMRLFMMMHNDLIVRLKDSKKG